jgi:metallo-beta-lactamase class B
MRRLPKVAAILLCALPLLGQAPADPWAQTKIEWNREVAPFHVVGPVHFVGTAGLGVWLIATPEGHILIDGGLEESVPLIRRNIEALGFRIEDVRYLVNSHAHFDHAGGLAELKRLSGAMLLASAGDRPALEAGRHFGDNDNGVSRFPAVPVDGVIGDGQSIELGDVKLVAMLTPGHTIGCTSWTMAVEHQGRKLDLFFHCSKTVAGNRLVGNREHPAIAEDYARSFERMKQVNADILLTNHPDFARLFEKQARARAEGAAAFIDPQELSTFNAGLEKAFHEELERQTATASSR